MRAARDSSRRRGSILGAAAATIVALVMTSCAVTTDSSSAGSGGSASDGTSGPTGPPDTPPAPHPTKTSRAAAFLPHFDDPRFQVNSLDLAALADPLGYAMDLVEKAMETPGAPRDYGGDPDAPKRVKKAFHRATYMALEAVTCLHDTGHLEFRAYVDAELAYAYSAAVVLVVDGAAVLDLDVALCALSGLSPISFYSARPGPKLQPCVGARRQGALLATWIGTTDWMCDVLNRQPGAYALSAQPRDLTVGDHGVAVTSLQFLLNEAGADLTVDGDFGSATKAAVKNFQACWRPRPLGDLAGVAGATTRQALAEAVRAESRCAAVRGGTAVNPNSTQLKEKAP